VFDRGGHAVTAHGPGSVAVTGYSAGELSANPDLWLQMVVPEDRVAVIAQGRYLTEKHAASPVEHRIVRKDGVVRVVRSTLVPHLAPDGRLLGWEGLIQDVTERRILEDQLLQAQKLNSIGRLAGGVAHDFNNLLTAILGNAELANHDLAPGTPAREAVDEIIKAGQRASTLTRQLLAFARKQIVAPVRLNLSTVVTESSLMLGRLLGEHIEITTMLEQSLSPIEADPGQMEQLLVNLTVNARDAMPNGGRLTIETRNEAVPAGIAAAPTEVPPGRYVVLTVTDTGLGMSAEVLAHIFEPFYTTKGPGKGTGLGLATCHGIVEQNHGHISVFSEEGLGSTFRIMLPVAGSDAPAPTEEGPVPTSVGGTEAILVVEDEDSVRRLAVLGLRAHGYSVVDARDGQAALQLAADPSLHFDIVVSDVVMPGIGGPELARKLESMRPGVPVILVSGHAEQSVLEDGPTSGFSFLQKPFTPEALARRVRDVLDARP
jgi:two-component system, cell cycle sensor histidine kinase and response regulator CckA